MAHLHLHPGRLHWLYQYRFALAISQAVTGVSEALRAEGPESAMGVRQEDAETGEGRGCGGVGLGGTGGTARKVGETALGLHAAARRGGRWRRRVNIGVTEAGGGDVRLARSCGGQ